MTVAAADPRAFGALVRAFPSTFRPPQISPENNRERSLAAENDQFSRLKGPSPRTILRLWVDVLRVTLLIGFTAKEALSRPYT